MQLPGDDAQRHEDEQDVDVVAAEGAPDHVRDGLGVRLPLGIAAVAVSEQRRRLGERAIGGGGHVARSGVVVEAPVTAVSMELGL